MEDRIIETPKFYLQTNIKLSEVVLVYTNGKKWKIVPLSVLVRYPVIYDKYYDRQETNKGKYIVSDISVTYCPYTGTGVVYYGKYKPTNKIVNGNMVLSDDTHEIVQLTGKQINNKNSPLIRRDEVRIMIMRNALSKYPDALYLHRDFDKDPIVPLSYYTNTDLLHDLKHTSTKYHPKTFVLGIEYKNSNHDTKYSVIVGDDAQKNKTNSRDLNKNKYENYIDQQMTNIRERGGIIIPTLWFAWYAAYPKSKIVKL